MAAASGHQREACAVRERHDHRSADPATLCSVRFRTDRPHMSRFPTAGHPDLLGRPVPEERRERRQAALFDLASALGPHGEEGGDLRDPRLRPGGAVCRGTRRSSAISIVLPA